MPTNHTAAENPGKPVYPWGPIASPPEGNARTQGEQVNDASSVTLEQALDSWSVEHLDAASALQQIVRDHLKTTGYGHIGKAIAHLELPQR